MRRTQWFLLLVALLIGISVAGAPARAQAATIKPGPCQKGKLPHQALWLICVPASGWNGDLVIWAHGYVAFNQPLDFYHLTFSDGIYLPDLVQGLGFAFATTSYRQNGLAILTGTEDIAELAAAFPMIAGHAPHRTYLTGASEGGIITALAIERQPELYSGGLAACGPIGSFRTQLNYWGDFRVLFDYFFPDLLPGSPIHIPQKVIRNWENIYAPRIKAALAANPRAASELIRTSRAPIDRANPSTIETTTLNLLWYNVFATNDGVEKLGGSPFDNRIRWYAGSSDDLRLNQRVRRFEADAEALANVSRYETLRHLARPLVTIHTTGDEIIPYWHELLYALKAHPSVGGSLIPIPIFRYGHCSFKSGEILAAFGLLVLLATGNQPGGITQQFTLEQLRRDFEETQREFAARRRSEEHTQREHEMSFHPSWP